MMKLHKTCTLRNGVEMPLIGIGTHQAQGEGAVDALTFALQEGYRLIDTAAAYCTEPVVAKAVKKSGVPREEVFITSKLRNACHGYQATKEAFDLTLQQLETDYLDLYLIHWPNPIQYRPIWQEATIGTWKAFEELYKEGRIRAIGVSNFMPHHIELLRENCEILPMVDQLRLCPGVTQPEIVQYCKANQIAIEAYSPFGTGSVFKSPELQPLCEKYGKNIGQICLRWSIQMGFIPLPKSVTPARIRENLDVFDFELDAQDMKLISDLEICGAAPDPDQITF